MTGNQELGANLSRVFVIPAPLADSELMDSELEHVAGGISGSGDGNLPMESARLK
jgi:hypothetical protein